MESLERGIGWLLQQGFITSALSNHCRDSVHGQLAGYVWQQRHLWSPRSWLSALDRLNLSIPILPSYNPEPFLATPEEEQLRFLLAGVIRLDQTAADLWLGLLNPFATVEALSLAQRFYPAQAVHLFQIAPSSLHEASVVPSWEWEECPPEVSPYGWCRQNYGIELIPPLQMPPLHAIAGESTSAVWKETDLSAWVVTFTPEDSTLRERLQQSLSKMIRLWFVPEPVWRSLLCVHRIQSTNQRTAPRAEPWVTPSGAADKGDTIDLYRELLQAAVEQEASDLHLEPAEGRIRVRFRVDGILREQPALPESLERAIVTRFKVMATGVNAGIEGQPQGGNHLFAPLVGAPYELRFSFIPDRDGRESIVVRLHSPTTVPWKSLQMEANARAACDRFNGLDQGLCLITGPTGSGKTTTLYSILAELTSPENKVMSIEDPPERRLRGVVQVATHDHPQMTFAGLLRHFLRQNPNVILLGEIRDAETAHVALAAATSGHLVFSTLHTTDCAATVERMLGFGVAPTLLAQALRLITAQRLIPLLCEECAGITAVSALELPDLPDLNVANPVSAKPVGCPHCHFTGWKGRQGIAEVMVIDETFEGMIADRASTLAFRQRNRGLKRETLLDQATRLALNGKTSLAWARKFLR